jgi:hypothetical protein
MRLVRYDAQSWHWPCHSSDRQVSRRFSAAEARIQAQIRSYGICGGQSGTRAGFLVYFGFSSQLLFHRILHNNHLLSSGSGTIGQTVAAVPNRLSLTPTKGIKKENILALVHYLASWASATPTDSSRLDCHSLRCCVKRPV